MSEETLVKPGTLKIDSNKCHYRGSEHPKVLVVTENDSWVEACRDYWQVPNEDFGYITVNSKPTVEVLKFLDFHIQMLNPELIVTFGTSLGRVFKPDSNLKFEKGKLFNPEMRYKKYKLCTLASHSWFKHQKWQTDPWKQHNDLKRYLMGAMKYGY